MRSRVLRQPVIRRPLWTVVAAVIIGWGAALLPLGLTESMVPGLIGFAAGGVVAIGAQSTLLLSGLLTIALGAIVALIRPARTRTAPQAPDRPAQPSLDPR